MFVWCVCVCVVSGWWAREGGGGECAYEGEGAGLNVGEIGSVVGDGGGAGGGIGGCGGE